MNKFNNQVNQRLANFITEKQLLIKDKNNLYKYKKIYLILKVQILLESEFVSPIFQQLTLSIEAKINPINNRKQQRITSRSTQISLVPLIY